MGDSGGESPGSPVSMNSSDLFTEKAEPEDESHVVVKASGAPKENDSSYQSSKPFCLILNGMYSGHLAKITSENKKCGRFNMRLVSPVGHNMRKKDGTVVHTALAKGSFEQVNATEASLSDTCTLDTILAASGSAEAQKIRQERLDLGEKLTYTVSTEYRMRAPGAIGSTASLAKSGTRAPAAKSSGESALPEMESTNLPVKKEEDKEGSTDSPMSVESVERPRPTALSGFPCLFYGIDAQGQESPTEADVLPLVLPGKYAPGYAEVMSRQQTVAGPAGVSRVRVKLDSLLILDEELLEELLPLETFGLTFAYLSGLLSFVDWTEYFKDTFIWPGFTMDVFQSEAKIRKLFDFIRKYPIGFVPEQPVVKKESVVKEGGEGEGGVKMEAKEDGESESASERSGPTALEALVEGYEKVFLLFLCGFHTGLLDLSTFTNFREQMVTKEVKRLMESIALLKNGSKPVHRSSSRVGDEYQTGDVEAPSHSTRTESAPAAWTERTTTVDDALVRSYLGQVQSMQERCVSAGQIVEVPVNFAEFSADFERYLAAFEPVGASGPGLEQFRKTTALNRFLAEQRMTGKRLTTVAVVKSVGDATAAKTSALVTQSSSSSSNNAVGSHPPTDSSLEPSTLPTSSSVTAEEPVSYPADVLVQNEEQIALRTNVRYCRFLNLPEDQCFEILHSVDGDVSRALKIVESVLSPTSEAVEGVDVDLSGRRGAPDTSLEELKLFSSAVRIYPYSFNKVYKRYQRVMDERAHLFNKAAAAAAAANESSSDDDDDDVEVEGGEEQEEGEGTISERMSVVEDAPSEAPSDVPATSAPAVAGSSSSSSTTPYSLKTSKEVFRMYFLFFPLYSEGKDNRNSSGPPPAVNALTSSSLQNYGRTQQSFLDHSKFHVSSTQYVPSSSAVAKPQPGRAPISVQRRDATLPNRWPASLPLMAHSMYWLKTSNSPCLCVGLDEASLRSPGEGWLTIITVCCATYHHAVSVPASKLEPLDEEIIKQCGDERAVGFALAMIDFAEYELQSLPLDSMLRRWYIFPAFIRKFLHNMQVFASWRKQVERSNRDSKIDRRKVYYNGLVETYCANIEEERRDVRLLATSYPWDDAVHPSDVNAGESSTSASDTKDSKEAPAKKAAAPSSSSASKSGLPPKPPSSSSAAKSSRPVSSNTSIASSEGPGSGSQSSHKKRKLDEGDVSSVDGPSETNSVDSKPPGGSALYNLFWVSKSRLPCVYYDEAENRMNDKVVVLPICCSTYHYPVEVVLSYLEPLRVELLRQCTDERTHDFALSLIEFARWEIDYSRQNNLTSGVDANEDHYDWPTFILELLNQPKEWAVWRKKVERAAVGRPGSRSFFYFEQLKSDYMEELNALPSESGSA